MKQPYYDDKDQYTTLIKMDHQPNKGQAISGSCAMCHVLRIGSYIIVVVLLCYNLWRIQIIESALEAHNISTNASRGLNLTVGRMQNRRVARSVEINDFVSDDSGVKIEKISNLGKGKLGEMLSTMLNEIHDGEDAKKDGKGMKSMVEAWFSTLDTFLLRELANFEETIRDKVDPRKKRGVRDESIHIDDYKKKLKEKGVALPTEENLKKMPNEGIRKRRSDNEDGPEDDEGSDDDSSNPELSD